MIDTDDFLADLERHLQAAAERRDAGIAPRRRLALRPHRSRVAGLALAAVAVLAAVVAIGRAAPSRPDHEAVATPSPVATPTRPSAQVEAQGKSIAQRAARDVARSRTCRVAPDAVPAVVDTPLSRAIANLLPGLASGPGADPRSLRLEPMTARGVLRSSVRELSLGSGLSLTVYVLDGLPVGGLADPAGCLDARLAVAASLWAGRSAAVQRSAESQVRAFRDTAPDLQTLMLQVGRAGAGLPVWSQHALRPGVVLSGSAGAGRYVAIAERRATHVVVHAPKPFTVPVVKGFYGLVLERGTGRVRLDETAADGTVVATRRIR
jgi:hypothetical protein